MVENPPANAGGMGWIPGLKDPLEKEMTTHSSFLPGESHGQRSLVGYSPWACKELEITERLKNNKGNKKRLGMLMKKKL